MVVILVFSFLIEETEVHACKWDLSSTIQNPPKNGYFEYDFSMLLNLITIDIYSSYKDINIYIYNAKPYKIIYY